MYQTRTIEDFLRDIIGSWRGIRRWQGKSDATYEDDLMHSFKTAMQALLVLSLEDNEEARKQKLQILILAIHHDVSEACLGGDVIFPIKKRLCGIVDKIEAEEYVKRIDELPLASAEFLKSVNKIMGDKESVAGRFFAGIEHLGYLLFSSAEIYLGKSNGNREQFREVLRRHKPQFLLYCDEFQSFNGFYDLSDPYGHKIDDWSVEIFCREIITAWEKTRAWPEYLSNETLLERTMKIIMLASILIPIEMNARKENKSGAEIDYFLVLAATLVYNLTKSRVGVLPHRLKYNPEFDRSAAREIEKEYFLEMIKNFPEKTKIFLTRAFNIKNDSETIEGRFFNAIKILSYAAFALREYENGFAQYKEVLENCLKKIKKLNSEFKSFDTFYLLLKHRVENIVEGSSKIWVDVK